MQSRESYIYIYKKQLDMEWYILKHSFMYIYIDIFLICLSCNCFKPAKSYKLSGTWRSYRCILTNPNREKWVLNETENDISIYLSSLLNGRDKDRSCPDNMVDREVAPRVHFIFGESTLP